MNQVETTTLSKLASLTDKGRTYTVPILGKQVWWSIRRAMVNINDFRGMWKVAGFDMALVPEKIQGRSCVIRTMKALEIEGFVREISCDTQKSVFVLVDEKIDRVEETANYSIDQKLIYDKKTKKLSANDPEFQPVLDAWMEQFQNSFISLDIRAMILSAIKQSGALTLAERGGFYFIPTERLDIVSKLQALVEQLGSGSEVGTLTIGDIEANSGEVLKNFRRELIKDLDKAFSDLEEIEENPLAEGSIGTKKRENGLIKRLDKLKAEANKVSLYEDLLKYQADDLREKVESVMSKAKNLISAI